ncbi:thiamine diphosphokinase, partial [Clostridium perfringens]
NIDVINSMEASGVEKITFKKEKDFTDTQIAFELAIEKGAKKILLLGVTGTRYDHSLSNIGLMLKGLKKEVYVEIVDDNNKMFLTDKNILLKGSKGDIVSFHAYSEIVKKLTISGAKYELFNYDLSLGDGLTTSNEFVGKDIKVTFDSGILMVLYTKD